MDRFEQVRQQVSEACSLCGRDPASVILLGVSKHHGVESIRDLVSCGLQHVGESYVQEALQKQLLLKDLSVTWHFIGPLQSNKTKAVAAHFDWVHSVSRLKILQRLSAQRPDMLAPLNICLQVNVDHDDAKQGCEPGDVVTLVRAAQQLPNIRLRGLMCIPSQGVDPTSAFNDLAMLRSDLQLQGFAMDTLSMGMSGDFPQAIAAGSTIVRVGTALFGQRKV